MLQMKGKPKLDRFQEDSGASVDVIPTELLPKEAKIAQMWDKAPHI